MRLRLPKLRIPIPYARSPSFQKGSECRIWQKSLMAGKTSKSRTSAGASRSRTAGASTPENTWNANIRKRASGKSTPPSGERGSDLGCLRVGADVIAKNPDAVFVEFAVNDAWRNPREIFRDMEGIVRQIWAKSRETDICFVYTVTEKDAAALENGKMSRAASAMEALADYYGIPSIHFGKEIAENLASGNLVMKTGADVKYVDGEALDENAAIARTPTAKSRSRKTASTRTRIRGTCSTKRRSRAASTRWRNPQKARPARRAQGRCRRRIPCRPRR